MANREKEGIGCIYRGRIDFYFPIKYETDCNFQALCNKINECLNRDINNHYTEIRKELEDLCAEFDDTIHTEMTGKLPLSRKIKKIVRQQKRNHCPPTSRSNDGSILGVEFTETGFKIQLTPGEIEAYGIKRDESNAEYDQYRKFYGKNYIQSQERFVLLPLHVQLYNNEYVWLNAVLTIFGNKMGILKLELPLVNVSDQLMKDNNINGYVKSVENKWGSMYVANTSEIAGIRDAYIKKYTEECSIKIIPQNGMLQNVLLARFEGMPKQLNNIPLEVQEDLYKIIAAPVQVIAGTPYKQIAREYIENQSWGKYNMKYITSTTGGCLSIVDVSLCNTVRENYRKKWSIVKLTDKQNDIIDQSIIRDLCINVEFALIILLLKRMNASYIYAQKIEKPDEMQSFQNAYHLNLMYISELQESCFGTVSEQLTAFEQMMPYYLKESIVATKMAAIDKLLADQDAQRQSLLQKSIDLGGLVMALIFGLPAIYDTLSIIRNALDFITNDIPFINLENTSITVWLLLIIILAKYILSKLKSAKRKQYFDFL